MTNAEKLKEAAKLISEVMRKLDVGQEICKCCGHKSKTNWSAHQTFERLSPLVDKLTAVAGSGAIEDLDGVPRSLKRPVHDSSVSQNRPLPTGVPPCGHGNTGHCPICER